MKEVITDIRKEILRNSWVSYRVSHISEENFIFQAVIVIDLSWLSSGFFK